jgi:hypothetical protein
MERIAAVKDPGQWIVVSNDNAVLFAARQRRMKAIKSIDFVPLLNPPKPKRRREDDELSRDVRLSPTEVDEWLRLFEKRQK